MRLLSEIQANSNKLKEIETPAYIYSPELVDQNYLSLKECLGTKLIVSIKANSNVDLLNLSSVEKDGYEATSLEELSIITQLRPKEKFINNPSMDAELVRKSVFSGTTVIIDNLNQVSFFYEIAGEKEISVMLRVNGKDLSQYYQQDYRMKGDYFGLSVMDIKEALVQLKEMGVKVVGLHLFNGSHSFTKHAVDFAKFIKKLTLECEVQLDYKLESINFGGGFSRDWHQSGFDFEGYRGLLSELYSDYELYHESGRAIFETSGIYLTRVISTKKLADKNIVICDGGLAHNFLLAQTESTFKKYRQPSLIVSDTKKISPVESTLIGSSCNKDDVVGTLPSGEKTLVGGDIVIFDSCGAYAQTYSPVNFLSLKQAKSYIWSISKGNSIE